MHASTKTMPRLFAAAALLSLVALPEPAVAQQATGSFARTLAVTGPVDLEVRSGSGSIEVRTGQAGQVEISGRVKAGDWGPFRSRSSAQERVRRVETSPPIEQAGNRVTVGRIDDEDVRNHVSISYTLTVPPETTVVSKTGSGSQVIESVRGAVTATSGSGSIRVRGAGGDVRASTGSGSILADTVAGSFSASSGSGSIEGMNVTGRIEASTSSGSLRLTGLRGGVRASTSSGTMRVQGEPTADWRLSSSSGSVTIELGGKPAFALDAHSNSGRIATDYPVAVSGIINRRELRGSVNGGGPLLHVRTSSGGIHIR
jgi:hypothetical protein